MKLLIITAIKAFDREVKQMLKEVGVKTFTYKEVKGYQDISEEAIESNWFASEVNETESTLFYAFVKKEKTDLLFDLINTFNTKQETGSSIHVAVLNIEKSN
jgi:nitrogen regulatory protein PII